MPTFRETLKTYKTKRGAENYIKGLGYEPSKVTDDRRWNGREWVPIHMTFVAERTETYEWAVVRTAADVDPELDAKFYWRQGRRPSDPMVCGICGAYGYVSETQHNRPVHEAFALEVWGMHAVIHPARPFVEAWLSGETELPTNEEFQRIVETAPAH